MTQLQEFSTRLTRLEIWKKGNGAKGAEQRLGDLEEKCLEANCPVGKQFNAYIEENKDKEDGQMDAIRWEKQMRQTRITNIIGFLGLGVMIFVAMMWGG